MDYKEIAELIGNSRKRTPVKVYIKGKISTKIPDDVMVFPGNDSVLVIGDFDNVGPLLQKNSKTIDYYYLENDRRNSALPLLDLKNIPARIGFDRNK